MQQRLLTPGGLRLGRQLDEVEGRIVGGEGEIAVEIEPDHLAQIAADARQVDGLHEDRAAGQTERDRAGGELALAQLLAQRRRRILGVDAEGFHPLAVDRGDGQAVAEHDHPQRS